MSIGDRPTDMPTNSNVGNLGASPPLRESRGNSPSLSEQTPGLEPTSRLRDAAMRPFTWVRERPAMALSLVGGLLVIGVGTWLALRGRRQTKWEMIRDRVRDSSTDLYDWMRSKL